ncbi:MAG TPA: thymidylate kinase-like protein [Chloroflexota bacterium]|nr:thymidylate kinase-like protein [Chloroflexota bacterium]HUM67378.1 thymidylate kinase-like protein [Chloroflexota bacterium]
MMMQKHPHFIYITGCDGTGKSTHARLLRQKMAAVGIETSHLWLRFPFFSSLPLLAYARWRGYSWYETKGNVRHGYWDFRQSRLLRLLFPWFMLLDATIAAIHKIVIPQWQGKSIVCERFVLDILVDMSLAFGERMHCTLPGKLLLHLLPAHAQVVVLDLDEATTRKRRADLVWDKRLPDRLAAFNYLVTDLSLLRLSSLMPVADVSDTLWLTLGVGHEQ